jgi:hypothetical protein
MKTLVLTAALVVLTAVSYSQITSENRKEVKPEASGVKVAMYSNVSDQVTFIVMKEPDDKLNLKIKDENGSLVYEKRLRKPVNRKITFDLKNLPEGKYSFELAKSKDILYTNNVTKGAASIALSK